MYKERICGWHSALSFCSFVDIVFFNFRGLICFAAICQLGLGSGLATPWLGLSAWLPCLSLDMVQASPTAFKQIELGHSHFQLDEKSPF